jgi:hypothetical protein
LGGHDTQVYADQLKEMADREFQYFVHRMASRGTSDQAPRSREEARQRLLTLVDDVIMALRVRAIMHAEREEASLASDRLAFDPSPGGRRMQRLQSRLQGSLLRTINLLNQARRRPDAVVRRPSSDRHIASSPCVSHDYEKVRNEPNADAGPAPAAAVPTTPERGPVAGFVHLVGAQDLSPEGCTHTSDRAGDVVPSTGDAVTCEKLRNEPNADPGSATESVPWASGWAARCGELVVGVGRPDG